MSNSMNAVIKIVQIIPSRNIGIKSLIFAAINKSSALNTLCCARLKLEISFDEGPGR
jgi:hypothetical protein